jgi:spectinomycin phosphotransferase
LDQLQNSAVVWLVQLGSLPPVLAGQKLKPPHGKQLAMLEKPDLQEERIIACLEDEYGLPATRLAFLPVGADLNTAVYRVVAADDRPYFLKLRSGPFDESHVALTKFLSDQGIEQIIAPIATQKGQLWASLESFMVILYPFVEGQNGFEVELTDRQWSLLGSTLRRVHSLCLVPF